MAKEEVYRKRIGIIKWTIIALIILLVAVIIWVVFIYTERCNDKLCFDQHLALCKRISWVNDAPEAAWIYEIKNSIGGKCNVEVTLDSVKKGNIDVKAAEGKSMNCYILKGVVMIPGQNLDDCTGPLKETLQDLIIKRMHAYILENLGKINEELTTPIPTNSTA